MAKSLTVANLLPQNGNNYQLLAVMLLIKPNGELPVAVKHSQLRTMVSKTVDPIDGQLHPALHRAVPLGSMYCMVQCLLQITRLVAANEPRRCGLLNSRPVQPPAYNLNGLCGQQLTI